MFYFIWAIKNLFRNASRSVRICLFIIIITTIMFLNFAFLDGTQKQMKNTLRLFNGDITLVPRKETFSLYTIKNHIENSYYKDELEITVGAYSFGHVRMFSANGYLNDAYVKSYSDDYYNYFEKGVEWIEGGIFKNESRMAIIEKTTASQLALSVGDKVTVEYKNSDGAINTSIFEIYGIFIGNKYIHYDAIYVNLSDAQDLGMVDNQTFNRLHIYLKNPDNESTLKMIVNEDLKTFSDSIYTYVWKWKPDSMIFSQIFSYAHVFMKILIGLITIVLLLILFFGINNIFYLIYSDRNMELSVLTTYGMSFFYIYIVTFWETVILMSISIFCSIIVSHIIGLILSLISMATISDEMVVVLGGPRLQFTSRIDEVIIISAFIFAIALFSTFYSLRKYFKVEVRAMQEGI